MGRAKETDSLALRMARKGGISISAARNLEADLTEILTQGLLRDGEVKINGLGRFELAERSAQVWDPKRRQMVKRRERRAVRFRGAAVQSQMLNAKAQRGKDAKGKR